MPQRRAVAQARTVVDDAVVVAIVHEPNARKGVAFLNHQKRRKAHLLETRGHEDRGVEAVAHLLDDERVGEADLLPHLLEARREPHVGHSEKRNRLVERP